jgi:phenylpropionate dioxygenase-like ring-hydroxylating dioxygenase large terminal subunit
LAAQALDVNYASRLTGAGLTTLRSIWRKHINLLTDSERIDRILDHIDNKTTDLGEKVWREPVSSYATQERFNAEIELLRRSPTPFCPTAMLPEIGNYVARKAAGTPLLVVRGEDGEIRAFINACRHRGMSVANGSGCKRTFVCPYHAWTYALDGSLKNIAGKDGFAGVDIDAHGLVQVGAREKGGLVYVNQSGPISEDALKDTPNFFGPDQEYFEEEVLVDEANWKLLAETALEGYHIRGLHQKTFYPYGFDNLTLVEYFGLNSRITFPFKRINQLRDIERSKRNISGLVTSVYHLFPNTLVSVLSKHTTLTVFEPISPTSTQMLIYRVTNALEDGSTVSVEEAKVDAEFVKGAGLDEDRAAAQSIQQTVTTEANTHLTFGLFEKAIVHFHQGLAVQL